MQNNASLMSSLGRVGTVVLVSLWLLQGCAVTATDNDDVTYINTPMFSQIADEQGFSQAVVAGDFLFSSGMVGIGPDGALPSDLEDEMRTVFLNLQAVLAEAGLGFEDVIDVHSFHVVDDPRHAEVFYKVYREFISAPWPANTGVGISAIAFPGAHLEVRVTAKLK